MARTAGTLALVGGGEWTEPCRAIDTRLLEAAGTDEVIVVPTAAAFEQPAPAVARASAYFEQLGVYRQRPNGPNRTAFAGDSTHR